METFHHRLQNLTVFKPTGETIALKELKKKHEEFFQGELTEDFANYCAREAVHAFWINYKSCGKKIEKEMFSNRFKEIINEMLNDL